MRISLEMMCLDVAEAKRMRVSIGKGVGNSWWDWQKRHSSRIPIGDALPTGVAIGFIPIVSNSVYHLTRARN